MPRLLRQHLVALLFATLIGSLAGCGFQPRGQTHGVSDIPAPLHIRGVETFSPIHRELAKQLTAAGVTLSPNSTDSAAVLTIREYESDQRVLSVDNRNRAIELELEDTISFAFHATGESGSDNPQTVRVLRILFRPPETILGSSREAELLSKDMLRELVQRLLQRVAAQH